jgi:alkylated DNA repair dioxygenase AlkB
MVLELVSTPEESDYDDVPDNDLLVLLGQLYPPPQCQQLLQSLIETIDWQYEYFAFGRRFDVPRVQAWYADPGVHYRYSNNMLEHRPWLPQLLTIKQDIERKTGHGFNSVLVTYYRDGNDHVTYHADNEPELGETPYIASLSLGATREFHYRHKHTGEVRRLPLRDGELVMMQPDFQHHWDHCVPIEPQVAEPRLNLTFRQVYLSRDTGD